MTIHPSVPPRTVIITGGNTGLGYACARAIAASHANWHIVIASRNQQQATQAVTTLRAATGNQHIEQMPLDLASLTSVRAFARDFIAHELPPLGAAICNAGIQVVSETTYTQDGFETTFGVNCLGHFLLVNLLLRHLDAPAQIVFVSSGVHYPGFQDIMSRLTGITPPHYRDARALAWPLHPFG
jgi:NAD(P)-dependent dehydrogenase (short-subunit alcohol dehydrogenase family)